MHALIVLSIKPGIVKPSTIINEAITIIIELEHKVEKPDPRDFEDEKPRG